MLPVSTLLRTILLSVLLAAVSVPAAGQDAPPLTPDRPGFGDGTALMAPGRFQLEVGYAVSEQAALVQHALGQALLRIGATRTFEARIGLNSFVFQRGPVEDSGFEDVFVGLKARLLSGSGRPLGTPSLTALISASLPVGSDLLTGDVVRQEVKLALDWGLTDALTFSSNAGVVVTYEDLDRTEFFTYASLGTGLPGVDGLGVFVGLYSLFPDEADAAHGLDGGLTLLLDARTQLDVNGGIGLTDEAPDYTVGVGLARRF